MNSSFNLLKGKIENKKDLLIWTIVSVVLFSVIAHGYRFTHNMYTHDALLTIYQNDYAWQIAIGRIFIPIFVLLRGSLCNPWIICICCALWASASVYLMCDLLGIRAKMSVILIAGVCVCNSTATAMNAAYLMDLDLYEIALFTAVLFVWLIERARNNDKKILLVPAAISLMVSLGIYQAYVDVAIGLILILLLKELIFGDETIKRLLTETLKTAAVMLMAALLYYAVWKLFQKIFNVWTANSYNGLSDLGNYEGTSIIGLVAYAYRIVWNYLWNPTVFKSIVFRGHSLNVIWIWILRLSEVGLISYSLWTVFAELKRKGKDVINYICAGLILILFPFGINFVCFLSKGMEHTLMIFSFVLIFVFAVVLKDNSEYRIREGKFSDAVRDKFGMVFLIPFLLLIWNNIVYSNQVYLKVEFMYESAESLLTRIVYDVEHTEGYEIGITPVAIYGNFVLSDYATVIEDFEGVECFGVGTSLLTYEDTDYSFLKHILGVNMNLTRIKSSDEDRSTIISKMPCYPENGSVAFVGDILVIKISD